ncbi:diguanylate cyclase [Mizugakiibacter sediminis]|uniref:diguanylate cyclase n=1 Tax=Mizugakiibacter sediminis TaxID=1475481 RepID=A0A0K8QRC8_9GAMM|nr:GGDEF domain-containing protein [Mizugakiibacter sediminis]GAP67201.1 diguanylate cyclase [Mizugakiibacter sediminis]
MPFDIPTAALMGSTQATMLAATLVFATRGYVGPARRSVHVWVASLLLQAAGWMLFRQHAFFNADFVRIAGNGLLVLGFAEATRTLRIMCGAPQHRALLWTTALLTTLAIAWFTRLQPSYVGRINALGLAATAFSLQLIWPLRDSFGRGGSPGRRVILLMMLLVVASMGWRVLAADLAALGAGIDLAPCLADEVNTLVLMIEPLLASVGFLLLYNEAAQSELARMARIDPLTRIANRRALAEHARRMIAEAVRHGREFAVLLIDADHFKRVNDQFGHAGGDSVLCTLVARLQRALRASDVLGRLGGEEFVALLPDTGAAAALETAERVRAAIAADALTVAGQPHALTVSIGVTALQPGDGGLEDLLHRADRALYAAKRAGRNRVVAADGGQDAAVSPAPATVADDD